MPQLKTTTAFTKTSNYLKIMNTATQPLALLAHIEEQMDPWAIKYTDSPSIPTSI